MKTVHKLWAINTACQFTYKYKTYDHSYANIILWLKNEYLRTHEIFLHKNNSPASPDKDTPLTGSCFYAVLLLF